MALEWEQPDNSRHPNAPGSVADAPKDEGAQLIAEMLGTQGFALYLERIVIPRTQQLRRTLLIEIEVPEVNRVIYQAALNENRELLVKLFENTEDGTLPDELEALFR